MRFATSRALLLVMFLSLLAPLGLRPQAVAAQDDAARFAAALASRDSASSLAGPLSGALTQEQGFNTTAGAGVSVTSFIASATFINPTDVDAGLWDFGISFHRTPEGAQQVIVDSAGVWYYSPFPEGTLDSGFDPTFNASPGGANTLDLVVDGNQALFGANGQFLATFDLPPATAADVEVGTAYFADATIAGRVVGYEDFEVWPLTAGPVATETPAATNNNQQQTAPVTPTAGAGAAPDADLFASVLASQAAAAPLAGPYSANLMETEASIAASWANVSLTDFHAQATFDVPTATAATPWDIGFIFLSNPTGSLRIAVDSNGNGWYAIGSGTPENISIPAEAVNTSAGGSNTLDLLVSGERGMLGINGEFAAAVDIPADVTAADVAVGTAFFSDQTEVNRITLFRDFVVLPLAPDAFSQGATGGVQDGTGTGDEGAAVFTGADADNFQALLAEIAQAQPASGPFASRLVEATEGTVPLATAGVSLADFAAVATVDNAADDSALWDSGFQFRVDGAERNRIVVDSLGDVYASLAGGTLLRIGKATAYDATPGGTNTIQLFVVGNRALFGVNGEFAAAVDLAPGVASDVLLGTGFFSEDFVVGRVTDYQDFQVWDLS
jgi:hypothetical protein